MALNRSNFISNILKYSILSLIVPLSAQSDETLNVNIFETGLYSKDLYFEWKPLDKELDLYSVEIGEINFRFSDIDLNYKGNNNQKTAIIQFSGPNFSLKNLSLRSNIHSENWVTKEKIERLEKRESIPKVSIESIASSIDLYMVDHNTLPRTINELVVKQYLDMDTPPLNDYSWRYDLELPEQIIAKPTQINVQPRTHAIYYDWQSR